MRHICKKKDIRERRSETYAKKSENGDQKHMQKAIKKQKNIIEWRSETYTKQKRRMEIRNIWKKNDIGEWRSETYAKRTK